ncbi:hypothetical protein ABZ313_10495 [Streptomyces sp. NPDC006251]|uniref:hypothetical protein n=1 Tax=Streptomyces sp. NPDC006251 TaxID=3155718 RepID=UPI0033BAE2B0
MLTHCAHARYVWNLAVEQHSHWRRWRRSAPGFTEQCRQLTTRAFESSAPTAYRNITRTGRRSGTRRPAGRSWAGRSWCTSSTDGGLRSGGPAAAGSASASASKARVPS